MAITSGDPNIVNDVIESVDIRKTGKATIVN